MIKSIINKYIKAILDELFINAPSVQLSMGADMFSDSKINLSNLSMRPDIFDVSLQPFKLISGHLGSLNVEGIAELALGGKLKFHAENVFILLALDNNADPEKIQTMKKILLEMQMLKFPNDMLLDIMKMACNIPLSAPEDVKKKRAVLYKAMDYITHGVFYSIKNLHIRIEFLQDGGQQCDAIGFLVPALRFSPTNTHPNRPDGIPRNAPLSVISCKSIQLYCDYDRWTYRQADDQATARYFLKQWKSEVHTSLVMPFDIDIVFGFDIKKRTGLVSPKVSITIPQLRFCVDQQQVRVLRDILNALAHAKKRFEQASRVQKIFRQGFPLPKVYLVGGAKVLPHLVVKNKLYPSETGLPSAQGEGGLVAFMKQRVGNRWTEMLWKHLIRCVLHDVRQSRPYCRWMEIARLSIIRREYAFAYAKLIKRADDGSFIFNVNAQITATKLRELFEYEMQLPIETVIMFRTLAYLVAIAGYIHSRKQASENSTEATSKTVLNVGNSRSIGWHDILKIYAELVEAQRDSAFHLFDRHNNDSAVDENDDYFSVVDDSMTNRGSDDGTQSVFSYSLQSRTTLTPTSRQSYRSGNQTPDRTSGSFTFKQANSPVNENGGKLNPFFSKITSTLALGGAKASDNAGNSKMKQSAQNLISIQNATKKLFSGASNADEYDSKVLGKLDLSAFSRSFGNVVRQEEKINKDGTADASVLTPQIENQLRKMHLNPNIIGLSFADIAIAVQTALNRSQSPLVIMPPDVAFKLNKISADIKTIVSEEERMSLISLAGENAQLTMTVSRSSSNTTFNSKTNTPATQNRMEADREDNLKVVRGFASLTGALIQLRAVLKECTVSIALPVVAQNHNTLVGQSKTSKGSTLQTGLPAYAINDPVRTLFSDGSNHGDNDSIGQSSLHYNNNTANSNDDTESDYHQLLSKAKNELEGDSDNDDGSSLHNGLTLNDTDSIASREHPTKPIAGTKISYIPGQTVLSSMQSRQDTTEQLQQLPPLPLKQPPPELQTPVKNGGLSEKEKHGKFDIDTSLEDMTSATKRADRLNRFEMRQIVSSAPAENVLVLCVILDLDDMGDGAGDVQLALGGMRVDLSKRALSAIISPELLASIQEMQKDLQVIKTTMPIFSQSMIVIDWEEKLPIVQLRCDPPLDILERWMKENQVQAPAAGKSSIPNGHDSPTIGPRKQLPINTPVKTTDVIDTALLSPESVRSYEREHHHTIDSDEDADGQQSEEENNNLDQAADETKTIETLSDRKERLLAMLFNKNIMQWLSLLEAHLPKVLTFSMRTSAIVIQSLEASVIRDLVYAKIRAMLDRASKRSQNESEELSLFSTSTVMGLLANLLYAWMDYPIPTSHGKRYHLTSKFNTDSRKFDAFRRIRKWGARSQSIKDNTSELGNNTSMSNLQAQTANAAAANYKLKLLFPPLDFAVTKVLTPYPAVDLQVQGMTLMKIPISDETLCHYIAWFLAKNMPIYI